MSRPAGLAVGATGRELVPGDVERPHREGEAEVQDDAPGLVDLKQYSRSSFVNFVSISQQSSNVRDIL